MFVFFILTLPYCIIAFYYHSNIISCDTFKGIENFCT